MNPSTSKKFLEIGSKARKFERTVELNKSDGALLGTIILAETIQAIVSDFLNSTFYMPTQFDEETTK